MPSRRSWFSFASSTHCENSFSWFSRPGKLRIRNNEKDLVPPWERENVKDEQGRTWTHWLIGGSNVSSCSFSTILSKSLASKQTTSFTARLEALVVEHLQNHSLDYGTALPNWKLADLDGSFYENRKARITSPRSFLLHKRASHNCKQKPSYLDEWLPTKLSSSLRLSRLLLMAWRMPTAAVVFLSMPSPTWSAWHGVRSSKSSSRRSACLQMNSVKKRRELLCLRYCEPLPKRGRVSRIFFLPSHDECMHVLLSRFWLESRVMKLPEAGRARPVRRGARLLLARARDLVGADHLRFHESSLIQ